MRNKRIFARYKVPTEKEFEKNLDEKAKFFNMTKSQYLDMYIKGRIGDIEKSTEIILREKQRIKKAQKCIRSSLAAMDKVASKSIKSVTKKYYKDLLDFSISSAKFKIKND